MFGLDRLLAIAGVVGVIRIAGVVTLVVALVVTLAVILVVAR